jgi:hypothetical protein
MADWQIKPFFGISFAGSTTFVDLEQGAGRTNLIVGVNGGIVGELLGIEADVARAPGFFQGGDERLILGSSATTFTGNIIVAMPKRISQYTLRPYFVGGGGIMRAVTTTRLGTLNVSSTLAAIDLGGGATGFLNDRIGLNWELRHFRSVKGKQPLNGLSFSPEQLAFWRATMAVAIRY